MTISVNSNVRKYEKLLFKCMYLVAVNFLFFTFNLYEYIQVRIESRPSEECLNAHLIASEG